MSLITLTKQKIILKFGALNNSGNVETQVALLSDRINKLKEHFSKHKKDYSSRRGLLQMVSHRRKLLNYLKKNFFSRYNLLIKQLDLRR